MEGEELGKLILYAALFILLILIVVAASNGQFNLMEKLGEILRFG